jgi:uncharacterized protein
MEWIYILIGLLLIILGLIGCFLPVLPGPPIAFAGLLLQLLRSDQEFSTFALVTLGILVVIVAILDYWFPIYGTKIFGGTKGGSYGSTVGLIIGLFFGPLGVIIGPFIGAYVGELINKQPADKAFKSAIGSFLGFLAGTLTKVVTVLFIFGYYIYKLF